MNDQACCLNGLSLFMWCISLSNPFPCLKMNKGCKESNPLSLRIYILKNALETEFIKRTPFYLHFCRCRSWPLKGALCLQSSCSASNWLNMWWVSALPFVQTQRYLTFLLDFSFWIHHTCHPWSSWQAEVLEHFALYWLRRQNTTESQAPAVFPFPTRLFS